MNLGVRRGEVWVADLAPRRGTEPGKTRPVTVIQTNLLNPHHASTLVCPITTKVAGKDNLLRVRLKAGEGGLAKDSDVMVDQVRAIDNARLKRRAGHLTPASLQELRDKLVAVMDLG